MKKIFIGNLSWKATEDGLKKVFEQFGSVISCKIITDQYTGKSKGFGFVEMGDAEGADRAIKELNDKPYLDRNMRVSLAQERAERPPREGGSGGYRGDRGGDRGGERSFRPRQERSYQ